MTGTSRFHTPKAKPMPHKRSALVASLDIGTSKIACMIARVAAAPPQRCLARPQSRRRADRLQPDPVARRQGRRRRRSRRMRAGGAAGRRARRAHGQGSGRVGAAVGVRRPGAGPIDRGCRRSARRRGDCRRCQPRHIDGHAPRHRRRPAACCIPCRSAIGSMA